MSCDKHIIETLGKAEVIIENGKITHIGEPIVDYCPIFDKIDNKYNVIKHGLSSY